MIALAASLRDCPCCFITSLPLLLHYVIALAASLSVYTAAVRLRHAVIYAVLGRLLQSTGAAADCFKLSQRCLCHLAMHGLATHQSSFCSHSSSKECTSYVPLSSPASFLGSSCVCLSTINTPPQSHARPDHTNDPDSSSVSNQSFIPKDSFKCDVINVSQGLSGAC